MSAVLAAVAMSSPEPNPSAEAHFQSCAERRQRLGAQLPANSAAIIPAGRMQVRNGDVHHPFRQSSDFYYLTDFDEPDAVLILLSGGGEVLFCAEKDPLKERWEGAILGPDAAADRLLVDICLPLSDWHDRLPQILSKVERLFVSHSTPDAAPRSKELLADWLSQKTPETANLDDLLHEMRLIKDAGEIERMRRAGAITAEAHNRMMAVVQPGMREYELEAECLHRFRSGGASGPAYGNIVGAGANACVLHYTSNDSVIEDGDLVLVDAGCEYRGYAADITRTFPANGRFGSEQKAIYEVVLAAQQAVIAELAPGVSHARAQEVAVRAITAGLVDLGLLSGSVDDLIANQAYRPFYMHRVGHWLGMDVHDVGAIEKDGQPRPFEAGMVMTVEPGIYIDDDADVPPGWRGIGVRIEDDVLITEAGAEVIGEAPPREVAEVEALCGTAAVV